MHIDYDRAQAFNLLKQHVSNRNLIKHMLAVEVAMRAYAKLLKGDENWWGNVGLLHDVDYEQFPNPQDHPWKGATLLRAAGYSEEFVTTVLAHASHTNEPRNSLAKKVIFSVDELCGLIVAVALVKPHHALAEVDTNSIIKKMKDKAFARQINRQEIIDGAAAIPRTLSDHIATVLMAMQSIHTILNL